MNRAVIVIEMRVTEEVEFGETHTTVTRQVVQDFGDDLDAALRCYDVMREAHWDEMLGRRYERWLNEQPITVEEVSRGVEVLSLDTYGVSPGRDDDSPEVEGPGSKPEPEETITPEQSEVFD